MVTYICDKCGERIYKAMMTTLVLEITDKDCTEIEEHHFCPECTEEFLKWEEER